MSSDSEEIYVSQEDLIIIEEVEKCKYIYDSNAYVDHVSPISKERKMDAFKSISKIIERKLDSELTANEIQQRWTTMRKGFGKALRTGKKYYLGKYLKFLEPYMKLKPRKQSVKKTFIPIILSPNVSTDSDGDLAYEDVLKLEKSKTPMKVDDKYFENLRKDLANIPEEYEVLCLLEICQIAQKYIFEENEDIFF